MQRHSVTLYRDVTREFLKLDKKKNQKIIHDKIGFLFNTVYTKLGFTTRLRRKNRKGEGE